MNIFILLLAIFPLLVFSCPPVLQTTIQSRETPSEYFLPQHVQPLRYKITLNPNLEQETIEGSVEIELLVLESSSNITLHIRYVDIDNSSIIVIRNATGEEVKHGGILWLEDVEHYVILLEEDLFKDENYTLKIGKYEGKLHTDNGGFYLAKYVDENGNERRLATTQFESTNARRAFPCLDEPALKATFLVNLIHPENYSSISNEIIEDIRSYGEQENIDVYKETVKMSTYLVAFVVSDFSYVENGNQKVYARPQAIKEGLGEYPVWAGVEILDILEKFLNYEYTPSKLDQIAFPDDYFAAGAMENWGLVTYRETNLLYSKNFSTNTELQRVLTVIAHEYGHQWFGNLVTLAWWEYLWLNEGFATYFQYWAAGELEPEWRLMDQFQIEAVQYGLQYDASDTTEAMNYATPYPGGGAPTYVSYQKGAAVIRMFEHFLTTEVYKAALNHYLLSKEYDAAVPDDLYYSLQTKLDDAGKTNLLGGYNVSTILKTWDSFAGYPVVNVERDYENGYLTLTQERFFLTSTTINETHNWYIPINFAFSTESFNFNTTTADFWFIEQQTTLNKSYPTQGFLIVNKQQTGFYRVNYDEDNWRRIIQYLNSDDFDNIHVLNRAQLVDDVFDLARAGRLNYEIALELSGFLQRETDFIVWSSFFNTLDFLDLVLSSTESYEVFKQYILILSENYYESLTAQESADDSHIKKLSRSTILPYLCRYGHEECRNAALKSIQSWQENEEQIVSPNLQNAFFCAGISEGGEEEWNFLYSRYFATPQTRSNQRSRIISGLGCSQNKTILYNYMSLALNISNNLESKHRTSVFAAVYKSGNFGLQTTFEFVKENYDAVKSSGYLTTVLSGLGSLYSSEAQLDQLKALAAEHPDDTDSFTSAITSAENNAEWAKDRINSISLWLETRVNSGNAVCGINFFSIFAALLLLIALK